MKIALEKFFSTELNNTTIQKEILAGITTFITMAYIIFVNPQMMAQSGMDHGAIFVGTCLAAAIACFVMGQLYKKLHQSFKRSITIFGTMLMKIGIHPLGLNKLLKNFIYYLFL